MNFNIRQWLQHNGMIFFSFIIALLAEIVSLPIWLVWFRPHFVLLVLIYWVLKLENKVSVGLAFLLGIVLDLLTGSIFAEHAVVLTVLIYFVVKYRSQIKAFPLLLQSIVIFIVTVLYVTFIFWIQGAMGQGSPSLWFFLSVLPNLILWSWFFSRLTQARNKIGLY
jgi:rod shape-determining protein MreD